MLSPNGYSLRFHGLQSARKQRKNKIKNRKPKESKLTRFWQLVVLIPYFLRKKSESIDYLEKSLDHKSQSLAMADGPGLTGIRLPFCRMALIKMIDDLDSEQKASACFHFDVAKNSIP